MSRQRDTVSAKYSAKHERGLLALHGQACELTNQHTIYSAKHDCGLLALHGQACELTDQHIKSAKIPRRSLLEYDTVTDKQLLASKKLLLPFSGQIEARRSLRPAVMPSTLLKCPAHFSFLARPPSLWLCRQTIWSRPHCDVEFRLVKLPAVLYRTRVFTADFTTACHCTLCSDKSIHFTHSHRVFLISILILSCPPCRQEVKMCQERVTFNGKAFISISVAD
jgi:hypothetical protein